VQIGAQPLGGSENSRPRTSYTARVDERRQHERFEVVARVELERGGHATTLTVLNISAGGVLLRNDDNAEFEIGQSIRIRFDVPELTSAFEIDATIVRVVAPTTKLPVVAAMWTSSDAAATSGLGQLLWSLKKP